MNYEELNKVNQELKNIDVKGKAYAMVNERINAFRKLYPEGTIETHLIEDNNGKAVFKALLYNNGNLLATGHAYEKEGSTFINKTSYIENCETSAIGRALAMLGIGIDASIASYEEVKTAMLNQTPEQIKKAANKAVEEAPVTKKIQKDCENLINLINKEGGQADIPNYEMMTVRTAQEWYIKNKKYYMQLVNEHAEVKENK